MYPYPFYSQLNMNFMTGFPFSEDVKRHILEFDPYPKEIHKKNMIFVLDDIITRYMLYNVFQDTILYSSVTKVHCSGKYSHFRSNMIYW